MSLAIETEKLTKAYGRKARGIEDVDLAVEEGEVFGFLGPNGAGKTTTVRTLLGFLRPTGGRGEVFGLDIIKDSVGVRARIGNLPGEFALEDKMAGEGLLRFFARLRASRTSATRASWWRCSGRSCTVPCASSRGGTSRISGSSRPCSIGRRS